MRKAKLNTFAGRRRRRKLDAGAFSKLRERILNIHDAKLIIIPNLPR
jgi:hypothetical protein